MCYCFSPHYLHSLILLDMVKNIFFEEICDSSTFWGWGMCHVGVFLHSDKKEKCRKHLPAAHVFYISFVFSKSHPQCKTQLRLLYLSNRCTARNYKACMSWMLCCQHKHCFSFLDVNIFTFLCCVSTKIIIHFSGLEKLLKTLALHCIH